jgi:hypothetical protein
VLLTTLVLVALGAAVTVACGGDDDDDLKDIKGTATAAASRALPSVTVPGGGSVTIPAVGSLTLPAGASATAGSGQGSDYRSQATALAADVEKASAQLQSDLLAAQLSQGDPKWPTVLGNDVAAVQTPANKLKALTAPAAQAASQKDVNTAADAIIDATNQILKAIQTGDQTTGLSGFTAFGTARAQLQAAVAKIPAS